MSSQHVGETKKKKKNFGFWVGWRKKSNATAFSLTIALITSTTFQFPIFNKRVFLKLYNIGFLKLYIIILVWHNNKNMKENQSLLPLNLSLLWNQTWAPSPQWFRQLHGLHQRGKKNFFFLTFSLTDLCLK